ncbi:MAG TPA: DUF4912 domain-containing protein, partial [Candidatus Polarisedimenticolia bacterium]|nr:DUF4912 domain-containing protein [Candidatus Polarisedimenticolia bacterium]
MLVHPRLLFLYWVVGPDLADRLRRPASKAEIRVETSDDGRSFQEDRRLTFDFRAPSWYLPNERVDCMVRVRLGLSQAGEFSELLLSNALRVPREGPGEAPEVWIDKRTGGRARVTLPECDESARATAPGLPDSGNRVTSPGGGTVWHSGRADRPAQVSAPVAAEGDLCLVLHSHLPFVRHPEREHFLEENWLFEAISETYLPLLDMFDHLAEDGV